MSGRRRAGSGAATGSARPRRRKYMSVQRSGDERARSSGCEIRLPQEALQRVGKPDERIAATIEAPIRDHDAITIVPKTFQPLPRTSSRLRPNASIAPLSSSTITGEISTHQVSRIRPGDDEQDEADDDPERGEEAGSGEAREPRPHPRERVADREVGPPVADVGDRLGDRALEPERPGEAETERARTAPTQPSSERQQQQRRGRDDQEEDERDRDEVPPEALVELPRLAVDLSRAQVHVAREPNGTRYAASAQSP